MCGLIGAVGVIDNKVKDVVKTLFILDLVRGHHSSGIAVVNDKKETSILKDVGTPFELLKDTRYAGITGGTINMMMCHNRYATKGAQTANNAHPFEMDHIIGAHNGTVHNLSRLKDGFKFDVDSQAIFNNISHEGIIETAKKVDGAYALTWYNKQDNTFNIARNKERPLYFAFAKGMKTLYWASEDWMLYVALNREQVDHYKITSIDPMKHYSIEVPAGPDLKVERFTTWRQVDLPEYERPKISVYPSSIGVQKNFLGNATNNRGGGYFPGYDDSEDSSSELAKHQRKTTNVVSINSAGDGQQKKFGSADAAEAERCSLKRANALLNKPITVTVVEPRQEGRHKYIFCLHFDGGVPIPVRCYVGDKPSLYSDMGVRGNKYSLNAKFARSFTVAGVTCYYLVADVRSIKKYSSNQTQGVLLIDPPKNKSSQLSEMAEVIADVEEADRQKLLRDSIKKPIEQKFFATYKNELMQGKDIIRLCTTGCTWCSNPPNLMEANKFVWISHSEFVCGDCASNEEVKYYINHAV
jgi:predicted glutamine amidotransferase